MMRVNYLLGEHLCDLSCWGLGWFSANRFFYASMIDFKNLVHSNCDVLFGDHGPILVVSGCFVLDRNHSGSRISAP